jgi:hypothetical protein
LSRTPAPLTPDEEHDLVSIAAVLGFTQARIARLIGVGQHLLVERYREVLDVAMDRANCAVGGTLFKIATDSKHPNCATSAMFWMKTRMKWREVGSDDGDTGKKETVFRIIGGLPLLNKNDVAVELETKKIANG